MLPTFLIIGAMKCGTTSLYSYLSEHPEVLMSPVKEPDFFLERGELSLDEYKTLFNGNANAYGEASTGYTKYPTMQADVSYMYNLLPSAKLIYMVRDPLDRIVSHYLDNASRGIERKSLKAVLEVDFDQNHYVRCSRYFMQLQRYREHYPDDQILVLPATELREDRRSTLAHVFTFIGVDPTYWTQAYAREKHKTSAKRVTVRPLRYLAGVAPVKGLKSVLPSAITAPIRKMVKRSISRPDLPPQLRRELIEYLRDDVKQLRSFTGHGYADWCL